MNKIRKHYTAEEKVAILRRHLLEQEPISRLCEGLDFSRRYSTAGKEFFENGAAAFQNKARVRQPAERERIEYSAEAPADGLSGTGGCRPRRVSQASSL